MISVLDKITITKELEVTDLSGEKVMIDFETGKYFMIKGAGNDIWDIIQNGMEVQIVINKLLEIYDIDEDTCRDSVIRFLEQMEENGFIKIEVLNK